MQKNPPLSCFPRCSCLRSAAAPLFAIALRAAADPAPASPAPEPVRIVVEAEDMEGVAQDTFGPGPKWQVGRWGQDLYQNSVFGGVWASRLRAAMADATDTPAEAHAEITIPRDGTYKIWAKYECPPFFNYAFSLRLDPLAPAAPAGPASFEKIYGLLESAKHFSFTDKLTRGSLYWSWGLDHDAGEGYETPLKAGRYRLTLSKAHNPPPAGARSVDAILITSEPTELSAPRFPRYPLLDELRAANHVYFRFRNLSDRPGRVAWNHWGHRYNDFYAAGHRDFVRFFDAEGKLLERREKDGVWPDPIPAGEASVWHDLGPTMNVESTSPFRVSLASAEKTAPAKDAGSLPVAVDIALQPNPAGIVKSFTLDPGEPDLAFLVQPDLFRPDGVRFTRKTADIYREVTAELDREPRLGPIPKKIKLFASTGGPRSAREDLEITQAFRLALGLNTFEGNLLEKPDLDAIAKWWESHGGIIRRSVSFQHSVDPAEVAARVGKEGVADYFYALSFGDEIGLPPVNVADAAEMAAFHEYVKAQGETPESLKVANWDQVKPLAALSGEVAVKAGVIPAAGAGSQGVENLKRLYWHSLRFRAQRGADQFAAKTRELTRLLGPEVRTTANLGGMHPFYWMEQAAFIDSFKRNAMSLAWSEDYTYMQPEGSRLVADFEAAYLRKGASYHDTPMMFYCMPHYPGNSPEGLLQNAVLEWSNNVKDFDWFNAGPDIWSTENYVTYRGGLPTWKALRTLSGMAGFLEDDLVPARPDPTRIAMLLSESSDVWELEGKSQNDVRPAENGQPATVASNVSQEERKALWYALRQAGFRVDFVTEDDVIGGGLKPYRVLYICGQNLAAQSAAGIRQWAEAGGVVFATAGAARKNEFDEPLSTLDDLLGRGVAKLSQRYRGPLRAKLELLFEKPLDRLGEGAAAIDALCSREEFTPSSDAQVLASFQSDGAPAFVRRDFGKGAGYYIGALPGQAFLKPGLPVVPAGKGGSEHTASLFEPVDYDRHAQDLILRPLRDRRIEADVTTGHRCVVSGRLSSPRSTVLPVVNLSEQHDGRITDLKIVVRNIAAKPARVRSCFYQGGVPFEFADGTLTLTLPSLQTADVVVITP